MAWRAVRYVHTSLAKNYSGNNGVCANRSRMYNESIKYKKYQLFFL